MPFALIIAGIILLVAAIKGNHRDLFSLLKSDFSGDNNFIYWSMAIVIIVSLGSIKAIKPVSDAFLTLIILVIIVAQYKGGKDLFSSFIHQIKEGTSSSPASSPIGTFAKIVDGKWSNTFKF